MTCCQGLSPLFLAWVDKLARLAGSSLNQHHTTGSGQGTAEEQPSAANRPGKEDLECLLQNQRNISQQVSLATDPLRRVCPCLGFRVAMEARRLLAGKVALVTGGASGIGAAAIKLFAAHGAKVVVADLRSSGPVGEGAAMFAECDVTQEEQVSAAVDVATGKFGRLDVMFNNAGIIGALGPIDQLKVEDIDYTLAVHVRGTLLGSKHAARVMKPQRSCHHQHLQRGGHQRRLGTARVHRRQVCRRGITKASPMSCTTSIRVNAIAPGGTDTPMISTWLHGNPDVSAAQTLGAAFPGKALTAEDMAQAALWLSCDLAGGVNGHVLAVDGGMTSGASVQPANPMVTETMAPVMEGGRRVWTGASVFRHHASAAAGVVASCERAAESVILST
eukprot:jgi/Tetstr1/460211/TSEL_005526.t1